MTDLSTSTPAVSGVDGRLELLRQEATEFAGLDLAGLSAGTRQEKIRRIAGQFEEMLIQTLLQSMEPEKTSEEGEDGMSLRSYGDLRRMFLSQYVASSGGLGYADIIRRQIEEKYGSAPAAGEAAGFHLAPGRAVAPVSGAVTSSFGWRTDPIDGVNRFHQGVDLRAPEETPVRSALDGTVQFSGWKEGYGRVVEIDHGNGLVTRYAHNSLVLVPTGTRVAAGSVVALSGNSGRSTGPHLHFEVLRDGRATDPMALLADASPNVRPQNADLQDVMA